MSKITEKFAKLGVDNAPGQEKLQKAVDLPLIGEAIPGEPVNFSHGDVDAFLPLPGAIETFDQGFEEGGSQAYTEYRGKKEIRDYLSEKLSEFSGAPVDPDTEIILTPGTQGALFLAMGALIAAGDKVAIIEPDYFANRKLVEFFDGILYPVHLNYEDTKDSAGIDLAELEAAFKDGVKLFEFSNPNNPTGVIYSEEEIRGIAELASKYNAYLIVDELYSRQIFDHNPYTHLRALGIMNPDHLITIIGPSKTESLSGFRLGVAYGSAGIIARMEKLQAIVSLRCAGYSQAVFKTWFNEPKGFMEERVAQHQAIRDDLVSLFQKEKGFSVRPTMGGSYIFPKVEGLTVSIEDLVKIIRVQAGVTVTPGTEFGPEYTNCFRLNFSQDAKKAHDAIVRAITVIKRYQKLS